MQQNTNLAIEIAAMVFACLLAIIGAVLLYIGKIDFNGALAIWGIASGVFGINLAFKAPSPSQQTQLVQTQQSLQQVISQFVGIIPGLVQVFQQQAQQTPVQPPVVQTPTEAVQPQQQAVMPTPVAPVQVAPQKPQFVPNPVSSSVLPAINLGAMNDIPTSANMATLTATPDLAMQTDVPASVDFTLTDAEQRNWNDSALIPVVQPQK